MMQNKGSISRSSATSTSAKTTRPSEVHVIEPGDQHTSYVYVVDEDETQSLLQRFQLKASKSVSWKDSPANGVLNEGFAASHSTGNRQRSPSTSSSTVVTDRNLLESPAQTARFQNVGEFQVLSAEQNFVDDPNLAICGVPDTACRRTLVGAYTLGSIETVLAKQGLVEEGS